jgi:hypothetical protein
MLKSDLALKYEQPQIKRGNGWYVPSFFRDEHRGAVLGLVRDVCSNDHEFGLAIVLGKLGFPFAHTELAAKRIALRPNLIEVKDRHVGALR